jgi:hypothetical protein
MDKIVDFFGPLVEEFGNLDFKVSKIRFRKLCWWLDPVYIAKMSGILVKVDMILFQVKSGANKLGRSLDLSTFFVHRDFVQSLKQAKSFKNPISEVVPAEVLPLVVVDSDAKIKLPVYMSRHDELLSFVKLSNSYEYARMVVDTTMDGKDWLVDQAKVQDVVRNLEVMIMSLVEANMRATRLNIKPNMNVFHIPEDFEADIRLQLNIPENKRLRIN